MTTPSLDPQDPSARPIPEPLGGAVSGPDGTADRPKPAPAKAGPTRAGAAWVATATALVVLALLVVFILQNQARVQVRFLGLEGFLPLGVALLVAAVAGGLVVTVIAVVRIVQLRRSARRGRATRR